MGIKTKQDVIALLKSIAVEHDHINDYFQAVDDMITPIREINRIIEDIDDDSPVYNSVIMGYSEWERYLHEDNVTHAFYETHNDRSERREEDIYY